MLEIRLATVSDLPVINAIYNHYVLHSTCTYQSELETIEARQAWFAARGAMHPATVATEDGEVVGWGALSRFHPRAGYGRTVENSLYVRNDRHRQGIGRALLLDLVRRAGELGHHAVIAGISADQNPSIALHLAHGFIEVGRLREVGHKFGRWLDVVYLQLVLPPTPRKVMQYGAE